MNFWHDVSRGDKAPEEFNCIIEIPRGSQNKYEVDKDTGLIKLDRVNYSAAGFPFDYGFVPQTLWEDGDPLDVVVVTTYPLQSGVLAKVRPVGVLEMIDSGESDYKIIAVPVKDKHFEEVKDIEDINPHLLKEFTHFFSTYKLLKSDNPEENKVDLRGFKGKQEAVKTVERAIELYKEKFQK